jgi:hypothetical protein
VGGWWVRYPDYESEGEYRDALDTLVSGALLALGGARDGESAIIYNEPFGVRWIEWLLPMMGWRPDDPFDPEWDAGVVEYARLFRDGVIPEHYAGTCASADLPYAVRFCADLTIRNYAPDSWHFADGQGLVTAYFHNTSSLGVYVPDGHNRDRLIRDMAALGLEYQPEEEEGEEGDDACEVPSP